MNPPILRRVATALVLFATLIAVAGSCAFGFDTFPVQRFGAACDGVTDDTAAVQRAIRAAEAAGGGIVEVPHGTCLLNSCSPSSHPWFFYNLMIGSNVTLRGTADARLLQGPRGRHPIVSGAQQVRNTVLAFGADYAAIRFQNATLNGGFIPLRGTTAGAASVTLVRPSDSPRFLAGDIVAIYTSTKGDVIPIEVARLTSVEGRTGVLGLARPLTRGFTMPVVARVTPLVTANAGVEDLTIEGTEPLAVTEAIGFHARNTRFVTDTSVGGGNVLGLNLNTLIDFEFAGNTFISTGPRYASLELAQRNSSHGRFSGNTFVVASAGFGEYASHITFLRNRFEIHANPAVAAGLAIGGQDVEFRGNDVRGGNITGGSGWGAMLADFVGPAEYAAHVGDVRIVENTFHCRADGNSCLGILGPDTSVTGNQIVVEGNALGIHIEGPLPQAVVVRGNTITTVSGDGILVVTHSSDGHGTVVEGNTLTGSGPHGIRVVARGVPGSAGCIVSNNRIRGFKEAVSAK
jgi:hypothetical protein